MKQVVLALKGASETARLVAAMAAVATEPESRVEVVHIVHVVELRSGQGLGDAEELVAEAVRSLEARGLRAHGHTCLSETEGVAGCLAEHARDWHAELIVMGSRGLGHVGGLFGRSVSHALLSKLNLPVLVVPTGAEVPARGFRRVLVAVRDVTEAEAAARAVRLLTPGVEVLAVHVPRALALHAGTESDEPFLEVYETSDVVLRAVHQRMLHHGIRAFTHAAFVAVGVPLSERAVGSLPPSRRRATRRT